MVFPMHGTYPEAAGPEGDTYAAIVQELDPDSVIESERLGRVLRLLRLPTWVVAAATLPRDIPTGPRTRDLIRLGHQGRADRPPRSGPGATSSR